MLGSLYLLICFSLSALHLEKASINLTNVRAGGSARVAKVLAFASFGLQILESVNYVDMSCNVFTS